MSSSPHSVDGDNKTRKKQGIKSFNTVSYCTISSCPIGGHQTIACPVVYFAVTKYDSSTKKIDNFFIFSIAHLLWIDPGTAAGRRHRHPSIRVSRLVLLTIGHHAQRPTRGVTRYVRNAVSTHTVPWFFQYISFQLTSVEPSDKRGTTYGHYSGEWTPHVKASLHSTKPESVRTPPLGCPTTHIYIRLRRRPRSQGKDDARQKTSLHHRLRGVALTTTRRD